MATFVLVHGGGDVGWYWHLVETELRERGHDVVAPDLPCDDDSAGLAEYADAVIRAVGKRRDVIVVGQSLGAFTAVVVCDRIPAAMLVLVAPMIPGARRGPGRLLGRSKITCVANRNRASSVSWTMTEVHEPPFTRVSPYTSTRWVHRFVVESPDQLDERFADRIAQAYRVGQGAHRVRRPPPESESG